MIGVLGGGQLGRMLALAGLPLGLRFRFLDPSNAAPAAKLGEFVCGDFQDPGLLPRFVDKLELVTYEFENVPLDTARWLSTRAPVYPPPLALEASQERIREKTLFQSLDIPTPDFAAINSRIELTEAVGRIGLPGVLKTCRFGYDGKGQRVLETEEDVEAAWQALRGNPLILEKRIPFECEFSILAVRSLSDEVVLYPLVENVHRRGILRLSRVPSLDIPSTVHEQAAEYARRLLDHLNYVGVLAIEFFQMGTTLLANEMAPRVHNSGHWTIEGAHTSQFANHLRALKGWPLGDPQAVGHVAMVNLIGAIPDAEKVLAIPGVSLHLYDKLPLPDRKVGHITIVQQERHQVDACLDRLRNLPGVELP
ncbi:5-(carboxyamino)imidazole ribonucleotide synthase [soil metagenome]